MSVEATPQASLLIRATPNEAIDAIVLPTRGRASLFVLAGYGNALRNHYSLAEPVDFRATVRMVEGRRQYDLQPQLFRTFPGEGSPMIDLSDALLYRADTPLHDYFPVYLVARDDGLVRNFEAQLDAIAAEAASLAKDWRLQNAVEWCRIERRANAGELQPSTGVKLPEKLRWRLRKPVFRAAEHRVLYQWELCSLIEGPHERPMITCVTDCDGVVARSADLVPIKLMFQRHAAMTGAPAARPAAAGAAPAPTPAAPAAATGGKELPQFRRQALEQKQRLSADEQMAKIRKLFEMPD